MTCSTHPSTMPQRYRTTRVVSDHQHGERPTPATMPHHGSIGCGQGLQAVDRESAEEDDDRLEAEHDRRERLRGAARGAGGAGAVVGAHSLHPAFQSSAAASASASPASTTDPAIDDGAAIGCRRPRARRLRGVRETAVHRSPADRAPRRGRRCASASLGALRVGRGGEHVRRDRGDLRDDAGGVLVGEHAEHDAPLVEVERLAQRRDERARAVRVVRGVDEHRGRDADELQPAGRRRPAEAVREDVAGDRAAIRRR